MYKGLRINKLVGHFCHTFSKHNGGYYKAHIRFLCTCRPLCFPVKQMAHYHTIDFQKVDLVRQLRSPGYSQQDYTCKISYGCLNLSVNSLALTQCED